MNSSKLLPDADVPNDWTRLHRDDRHSTVAHFRGGFIMGNNAELLVWSGVPVVYAIDPSGQVHTDEESLQKANQDSGWTSGEGADIEGYEDQSPDDDYQYLIEVHNDGEVDEGILCTDMDDVNSTIQRIIQESSDVPSGKLRSAVNALKSIF